MNLRTVLVLLTCWALCILESVAPFVFFRIGLSAARVDLLLPAVLYLALHSELAEGAFLAFAAGFLSDLAAATPDWLQTALSVAVFLALRPFAGALRTGGGWQSAVLTFAASLLVSVANGAAYRLFVLGRGGWLGVPLSAALWSALFTALAAPFVFSLLRRIDSLFLPNAEGPALGRLR